ncbi:NAD(P)/FAD-dependent oxidoreductase [Acetanaerobacterium elongatum]|uniref:Aminoacetone oxidase family FAD-binding enzyme n=1 Tax=Acetanaerobacterium elongatum TaxID=258515 RepID=A0A1H0AEM7_9FIRM|nr:NAD(P)/FAD-dependent oxidoreductase [Acetanaerobacterium elongatum]SDN32082.1 hypothetical protein SAMN05192585_1168 [Acetanaerobacterium elongatum]
MANRYDILVIGAGAAGLMAAGQAAELGKSVLLLEKNERPARKVMITGKGRCNVTNNCDETAFISKVKTNGRFLYSAISTFPPRDTIAFFEEHGLKLKTERGNRVFPVSDKAVDVVDCLVRYVKEQGVHLVQGTVKSLMIENQAVCGVVLEDGSRIQASSVVVATGGLSYPLTGSTGDGYRLARQAGHTIIEPTPSLVPIVTQESWCKDVMGLSLKNVTLTVHEKGKSKPVFSELGEMLFTHFGVSGPLVLSASSVMDARRIPDYTLSIDLKPGLSEEQLDKRLQRDFSINLNKDFINSLGDLLPKKLIPVIVYLCNIAPGTKVNQLTREMRKTLVDTIKSVNLTPKEFRPIEEAVITSGGVKVTEINPKTMQSKLCLGLYFAGEVIDVDAFTGGYNLQIAFSTGVLAGRNA